MTAQSQERREYDVGVQSFTYREFGVSEMCDELADTGVAAVELCHEHVQPSDSDDVDAVRETLAGAGLDICGYGVVAFGDDGPSVRETLSLVDRLGGDYCSLEFPPDDAAIRDRLLSTAAEFDLQLAIHNYGPGATYETIDDVAAVLDEARDPASARASKPATTSDLARTPTQSCRGLATASSRSTSKTSSTRRPRLFPGRASSTCPP